MFGVPRSWSMARLLPKRAAAHSTRSVRRATITGRDA